MRTAYRNWLVSGCLALVLCAGVAAADPAAATDPESPLHKDEELVLLPAPTGVSVVSDLDDTIKISQVTDRKKLLDNTFRQPFRDVPGMAAAYTRWRGQGAAFHYVSASPWQLYPALSTWLDAAGLPQGEWHMKYFRVKDESFMNLFASPLDGKRQQAAFAQVPAGRWHLFADGTELPAELPAADPK